MPNWLKNLIDRLCAVQVKNPPLVADEKAIEVLPAFTAKTLYVSSEIGLNVRSTPEVLADNKIEVIPHGYKVRVVSEQDKWFEIEYSAGKRGWVSSAHLAEEKPTEPQKRLIKEEARQELPEFKIGIANNARDPNTLRVRKIINHEFGLNFEEDELQCTEYVQYRVLQAGVSIKWPVRAGRNGGNWANMFEKHNLYKILVEPKAGCAMSFTAGFKTPAMNRIGHVAFVEQVLEDGSVKISEANWPLPGKYNERVVPVSEWRDKYKCRFVDFS